MLQKIINNEKQLIIYSIILIVVLTFIIYIPSINGKFVYDDSFYITNNYFTKNLTAEGLLKIWSSYIFGNYNPVTITSLAIDYKLFGLNTTGYHFVNIIFHLFTTFAILFFIKRLTGNIFIGIIASLIFAIHPIHVESVSWISGRKDLLFSLFFILSLWFYLKSKDGKSNKYYLLSLFLFFLSCLSKAVAVTLPIVLLLIDYLSKREFNRKLIIEKIPFFVVSLFIGIIAIVAQSQAGALRIQEQYGFFDKIILSLHALSFYLGKTLLPIKLSANYAFPILKNGYFENSIYLSAVVFIILTIISFYSIKYTRLIIFLFLFFVVTLFPVLQIVAVGNAFTADRFAYLPSLSVFIFIAWAVNNFINNSTKKNYIKLRIPLITIILVLTIFFSITTFNRAKVWQNDIILFTDMIEKNPNVPFYYNNLGLAYLEQTKEINKARMLFEKAITMKPDYSMAYNNLGNLYSDLNKKDKALQNYLNAIRYDSTNVSAYNNIGVIYLEQDNLDSAEYYLSNAFKINPDFFDLLNNYSTVLIARKNYNKANQILKKAHAIDKYNVKTYITFALLYFEQDKIDEAEEYILKALEIAPNNSEAKSFLKYIRNPKSEKVSDGQISEMANQQLNKIDDLIKQNKMIEAESLIISFVKNNPKVIEGYTRLAMVQTKLQKYTDALKAFMQAQTIEPENSIILKNMAVVYQKIGNMAKVVECYQKAARLGDLPAQDWLNMNGIKW